MNVIKQTIEQLASADRCAYSPTGPWAAEPTALTCLALEIHNQHQPAIRLAKQLADAQDSNGSIGALADHDTPAWPTSLAILAWLACAQKAFADNIRRAVDWSLATYGKPADPTPQVGHDPSILGWSWAADTHAWMEPTCMFVLALKAAGIGKHSRAREGERLIIDRLLPTGGSNYGSTLVLGQATLPQVQSTGLAMLALAGEENSDPRVEASLKYLEETLGPMTTTSSMCYGLLGLTAHNRRPPQADDFLQQSLEREVSRGTCEYKLALISLAALKDLAIFPGVLPKVSV
ncbi:hypothetical protein [Bythopirellula polymerisocia]|uniref:hypothetical protein n=1 Tax=Bythopirellula polymerisocia TaxID=2528003 RepID=UPI0018D30F4B|nr:hypothetical protein [Bythopirellula polymerisocia]